MRAFAVSAVAAVAAGCALVALSGCPGVLAPLEKPTLDLRGVSVVSVSFSGLRADARFDILNPNSIGVPLRAVDWELSIGGATPMRGRFDLNRTIPAKGSAPVVVEISIGTTSAAEMASRLAGGATDYHVSGTMHFQTSRGDIAVAFDHSGGLDDAL